MGLYMGGSVICLLSIYMHARDYRNQSVIQQGKVLLEFSNELIVLLWVKSSVTSRIWRPQFSRPKENGYS